MKTQRIALPILVACLALSACAGQDGNAEQEDNANPASTGAPVNPGSNEPAQPGGQPSEAVPGSPGKSPAASSGTITGTVTAGVEPGCLLIGEYLLVGGPRDVIKAGTTLTVTGRPQPDLMTTCQQGTPFLVDTARIA